LFLLEAAFFLRVFFAAAFLGGFSLRFELDLDETLARLGALVAPNDAT
jgi:hypothetical protein